MEDLKNAILAATDDNWREFLNSLDRLLGQDISITGVHDEMSLNDIVGHVTSWEYEMVISLNKKTLRNYPLTRAHLRRLVTSRTGSCNDPNAVYETSAT